MASPSRREPGSENGDGNGSDESKRATTGKVVRVNRPLGRPKPDAPEPTPKKAIERKGSLKPGDRIWSKPKREKRPASTERRVFLNSDDLPYEPAERTPPRGRPKDDGLPRWVGPAKGNRKEESGFKRPKRDDDGGGRKPYGGGKGGGGADRPAWKKEDRTPRSDSGRRPARSTSDRPSRPSSDRPAWKEDERKPRSDSGRSPSRSTSDRPSRPSSDRPAWKRDDRKPRPDADRRPARSTSDRTSRPSSDRPAWKKEDRTPRSDSGRSPSRPSSDRPSRPSSDRPAWKKDDRKSRPDGDRRPARSTSARPARPSSDRPAWKKDDRAPRSDSGRNQSRPSSDRPAWKKDDRAPRSDSDRRPARSTSDHPARPSSDRPAWKKDERKPRSDSGRSPSRPSSDRPAWKKDDRAPRSDSGHSPSRPSSDRPAWKKDDRAPRTDSDRRPARIAPPTGTEKGVTPSNQAPFARSKSNLRAAAARVIFGVLERSGQMKSLLQAEQKKFSFEADRALTREIVTGVFRHLSHLDWCVAKAASRGIEATRPELMALLRVGLYQILYLERIPAYAAVDQCVEAAKSVSQSSAGFVNGILRSVVENIKEYREAPFLAAGAQGLSLRYGMPLWMVERYLARIGDEETERMLAALQAPADTVLFFSDAAKLAQARPILERENMIEKPDPAFPLTLHVSGGNPADSEAFRQGLFYIADPASQVPALLLPLSPGAHALDLCAAPGGKSVILSGRATEGGWVLSTDVSRRRIHRIEENMVRMKIENVRVAQVDSGKPLPFQASWNSVLLDAPCSALGTLRRNPEIRWQIRPESLIPSAERQLSMLSHAADIVAPGGHLLYSVCTLEEEETVAVAKAFLAADKRFKAVPLSPPSFLAHLLEDAGTGCAYCLPHRHAWDGFFVALFQRKG